MTALLACVSWGPCASRHTDRQGTAPTQVTVKTLWAFVLAGFLRICTISSAVERQALRLGGPWFNSMVVLRRGSEVASATSPPSPRALGTIGSASGFVTRKVVSSSLTELATTKNFLKYPLYLCCVTHAVAVRAEEYALLQLFENRSPATAQVPANIELLLRWVQMMELQRGDAFVVPAVHARSTQVFNSAYLGSYLPEQRLAREAPAPAPCAVIPANT